MLECIKFGDCKIKTTQIEDEWFVSVRHIGITLGVSSVTLKGIVRNNLPLDMMLLIFLLRDIIIYKIRLGKYKKLGMWRLAIVYQQLKIIESTSILCLNQVSQHC